MRKHTWLAGWFPAEDPRAILVVYLHDVAYTSSHTAVHVASQFLRSPEVQDYVRESRR
jgi:cell division protein FtsI/penicillin-binding protein 2